MAARRAGDTHRGRETGWRPRGEEPGAPEEPRQPRNFKDRALVWISGPLVGGHVPLVDGSPRLLRILDRHLFLAPSPEETDRTFLAEDGSVWTFEFQFRDTDADVARPLDPGRSMPVGSRSCARRSPDGPRPPLPFGSGG